MSTKYNNKIDEIRGLIATLLESIVSASQISLNSFIPISQDGYKLALEKLNNIELQGDTIDNEIIKTFALFGPEAIELRSLVAYLKMTNEIVRIGEGTRKYARRMRDHSQSECNLEPLSSTISQLHKSTIKALEYILECFKDLEQCNIEDYYRKIMVEESKNDDIFSILEKEIMTLIIEEKELSPEYVKVLGTLRKLERSCDRSVNIANLMMYAKKGGELSLYR
ncbi:PhoU family transcriptional regulator [Candidatus Sulfurimonas marisnigri]|uniref:PhoU family transcriptional regulator n=1 Tax=Candidatus Sulfurimonas marisnigri TaxID=2740405 RepID=A0A7S7RQD2_9BACT|nr:PhoU domain-containing protein [Candidatus Sulfurimonas marisnigri]QOY54418.1 PhoU family transcriptional regulator [Candidatus Sulfurimonas marisnigri]